MTVNELGIEVSEDIDNCKKLSIFAVILSAIAATLTIVKLLRK